MTRRPRWWEETGLDGRLSPVLRSEHREDIQVEEKRCALFIYVSSEEEDIQFAFDLK